MATGSVGQLYYRVLNTHTGSYDSTSQELIDVFYDGNIVSVTGASSGSEGGLIKLGIQAPPGSQVLINEKLILIGRTGMYELDSENIKITKLSFVRPKTYELDEMKSNLLKYNGKIIWEKAEAEKKEALEKIQENKDDKTIYPTEEAYTTDYNQTKQKWDTTGQLMDIHLGKIDGDQIVQDENTTSTLVSYSIGMDMYAQGVNGVYAEGKDKNELDNVIIDYLYV